MAQSQKKIVFWLVSPGFVLALIIERQQIYLEASVHNDSMKSYASREFVYGSTTRATHGRLAASIHRLAQD